jgi:propionyl-CoA carboxylase alpha chain
MITSVLVANRGEIARRVFRTCRDLGIFTVAVFSDADANEPFVAEADAAVRLPGDSATDTYLRAELIIEAARRCGADAVHPGYGFLSENASFARQVIDAGLTWVGPPPESIDTMGSKIESKALMAEAGVPVLDRIDPDAITEAHLPVLIKASSGGGGRGMRIVTDLASLADELELASAEAASAFGDPTVFCEPYLKTGRHIEVQVMADQHGTIWAVGERECSIQRRHQKIVEEAPSPLVERVDGMRDRLFEASSAATAAIGYVGAGTVEFLADESGAFYFLEMNTRLQVEHPVTEATTGTDLVALHLHVADGGTLDEHPPPTGGHAIEVRLYAEDPAETAGSPKAARCIASAVPGVASEFDLPPGFEVGGGSGIRLDSGVGTARSSAPTTTRCWPSSSPGPPPEPRRRAAWQQRCATPIHGVRTNRALLVRILDHPSFQAGDTDTAFLDRHGLAALSEPLADEEATSLSALVAPSRWRQTTSRRDRAGGVAERLAQRRVPTPAQVVPPRPAEPGPRPSRPTRSTCTTGSPGTACWPTAFEPWNSSRWNPTGWCCEPTACNAASRSPSTGMLRPPRVRRLPARARCVGTGQPVSQRGRPERPGRCWRPCPDRSCGSRSPRATRSSPDSR